MKKIISFFIVLSFAINVTAQTTKGFSVSTNPQIQTTTGKTYALIIGISKYQNLAIPQLQFADRDAIAFRNYLIASGVDSNNITLLTNEIAKYSEILLDLDDICTNKVKAGDKFYFYFSGHGDVESRVITNDGYLLPYDAPKVVYAISAIPVRVLQSYISTLSSKGVQPIVITDACHSGNLAGGIEGMANIQNVLKDSWKDEIKILSCQPGEISLEGKQWGEGRGLFSYELTNGLAGMADKNKDGIVSMLELNLYLMEKVPDEANPVPQTPMLVGNMQQTISMVNKSYLEKLNSNSSTQTFASIDLKGNEIGLLKNLPDSVKYFYSRFQSCLDSNRLYSNYPLPDELWGHKNISKPSAYFYYQKIVQSKCSELLVAFMKRNLSAKMMDEINECIRQTVSNIYFSPEGQNLIVSQDYSIPLIEMLGREKLISLGMMGNLFYMKSFYITESLGGLNIVYSTNSRKRISLLDSAISYNSNAPHVLMYLADQYSQSNPDSAILLAKKAVRISPMYVNSYFRIAWAYESLNNYDSVIHYYRKFNEFGSPYNIGGWLGLGKAYQKLGNYDSSNFYLKKVVSFPKYGMRAVEKIGVNYYLKGDTSAALNYFNGLINTETPDSFSIRLNMYAYFEMARIYAHAKNTNQCLAYFEKALSSGFNTDFFILSICDSSFSFLSTSKEFVSLINQLDNDSTSKMSGLYYRWKKYPQAIEAWLKKLPTLKKHDWTEYNIACCYSLMKDTKNANKYMEITFEKGYNNYDHILLDTDLDNIRSTLEFKTLMKKYFPEQYKEE